MSLEIYSFGLMMKLKKISKKDDLAMICGPIIVAVWNIVETERTIWQGCKNRLKAFHTLKEQLFLRNWGLSIFLKKGVQRFLN